MPGPRIRTLWLPAFVWVLVVVGVAVARPSSRAQRLGNLDLTGLEFPGRYLVFSRSEPGRCWEVDRRDATLRRSNDRQPGRKMHCRRLDDAGAEGTWVLQSKRMGSVAFVPLLQVSDWTYPFLYAFVRARHPELGLPEVSWTQLYPSRLYAGLHLRVPLPYDGRKVDGRTGPLRELLSARGDELAVVDTRLEVSHGHYAAALADGRFPALVLPPPALRWLARRAPTPGHTFLFGADGLTSLPLPVSVPELFAGLRGRPAPGFRDERYRLWASALRGGGEPPPFGDGEWERFRAAFEVYADRMREALRVQGRLDANRALLEREIPKRQASLAGLGLVLGRL